jgi:hypothetical protein
MHRANQKVAIDKQSQSVEFVMKPTLMEAFSDEQVLTWRGLLSIVLFCT